jgi:hypothetical protein
VDLSVAIQQQGEQAERNYDRFKYPWSKRHGD